MSRLFRGKFLHRLKALHTAGELDFFRQAAELQDQTKFRQLLRLLYKKEWVVYAKQPFGGPEQAVNYLGRYTHRIAISNRRIEGIDQDKATCPACGKETIRSLVLPVLRTKFEPQQADGCPILKIGMFPGQRAPPAPGNGLFKLV